MSGAGSPVSSPASRSGAPAQRLCRIRAAKSLEKRSHGVVLERQGQGPRRISTCKRKPRRRRRRAGSAARGGCRRLLLIKCASGADGLQSPRPCEMLRLGVILALTALGSDLGAAEVQVNPRLAPPTVAAKHTHRCAPVEVDCTCCLSGARLVYARAAGRRSYRADDRLSRGLSAWC